MADLPRFALSVRQPWAWAIIHAGKDIENRSWSPRIAILRAALAFRGPVCIHAAKGMTRDEFEGAGHTFAQCGLTTSPGAHELLRGGIIGTVEITDVVRKSHSPWFFGSVGLVLKNPVAVDFIPSTGALGFFEWQPNPTGQPEPPARWMLPQDARPPTTREIRATQESFL